MQLSTTLSAGPQLMCPVYSSQGAFRELTPGRMTSLGVWAGHYVVWVAIRVGILAQSYL